MNTMQKYKVTYLEGLFSKKVKYVQARATSEAWELALKKAPSSLWWYKGIKLKEVTQPTAENYQDMKEVAIWGWVIAVAMVVIITVILL